MAPYLQPCLIFAAIATSCGYVHKDDSRSKPAFPNQVLASPKLHASKPFVVDSILSINLQVSQENWDELRAQAPAKHCVKDGTYTKFEAHLQLADEDIRPVTVKKKSYCGSFSVEKPSLKIKFDRNRDTQKRRYLYDAMKLSRLTLNNSIQDRSYLRQCLTYALYEDMGIPSPRCQFAYLFVNGQHYGLYINVEPINDDLIARHFNEDVEASLLYEFEYDHGKIAPVGMHLLEKHLNLDDGDTELDKAFREGGAFQALVQTLAKDAFTETDVDTLFAVVHRENFIKTAALELFSSQWDGLLANQNNAYAYYRLQDKRLHFLPWGKDQGMFLAHTMEERIHAKLFQILLANPEASRDFHRYLKELQALSQYNYLQQIAQWEALIEPFVHPAEKEVWVQSVQEVKAFFEMQVNRTFEY